MLIHKENALKAHQHITYCSIQRDPFKKKNLIQNLIKIFTKTHQVTHVFKIFSQGSMPCSIYDTDPNENYEVLERTLREVHTRVGVKYSTCTWYLYLSTYLSVLDVLEYLV